MSVNKEIIVSGVRVPVVYDMGDIMNRGPHICISYCIVCMLCTGWVLIDRSGRYFGTILDFLRDGSISLPETRKECLELLTEAK